MVTQTAGFPASVVLPRIRRTALGVPDDRADLVAMIKVRDAEIAALRARLAACGVKGDGQNKVWTPLQLALARLAADTATDCGLSLDQLCGACREAHLVAARRRFAAAARRAGASLQSIGAALGGRNDRTVANLLQPRFGQRMAA